MLYLVCYDVSTKDAAGRRRLGQVARFLERHGTRVQYSIFEVRMTVASFRYIRLSLLELIKPSEDSLRIYPLVEDPDHPIEHHGAKEPMELFGVILA